MPLKADHSGLASGTLTSAGEPPNTVPVYGMRLADAWAETIDRSGRAMSGDTVFRASWGGMCARAMGYNATGQEKSNPPEASAFWRMGLGTMVHTLLQEAVLKAFPHAQIEVPVVIDDLCSATVDIVDYEPQDRVVSIEVKTINGWGFKSAIGARGTAEGPKTAHKIQAFLGGYGLEADEVRIVYLSLENISPKEAERKGLEGPYDPFLAEWVYPRGVYAPLAEAELDRMRAIRAAIDADRLPPRITADMPPLARITNPATGAWSKLVDGQLVETGTAWQCGYCDFRDRCIEDGAS